MSLRCSIMGDCRRVALPAIFCLASLVSLLFMISYTNDRAMLHEAEIRAQAWLRSASRQLDQSQKDVDEVLAHAAADIQIDGVELLDAEGAVLLGSGQTASVEHRRRGVDHVLSHDKIEAWMKTPSGDDGQHDAIVALDAEDAIPGTRVALLTINVSAAQGHYWANAGWQLVGLAALLVITSGIQGSTCLLNLRRLRAARTQVEHVAQHDALTGLPNRLLFHERLRQGLVAADRDGTALGVLLLDLDRFKMINDTLGHPAGDELLQQVAIRLQRLHRAGDTVARLGGDEFALVLAGLTSADQVAIVARRIVEVLAEPFSLQCRPVVSTASVGIAIYPDDGAEPDELLAKADMALYRAKGTGRSRAARFEPAMQAAIEDDRQIEEELRAALSNDQFCLAYQPQIDLTTGNVTGVEALLRWRHAERGLLDPGDFIRVAEEAGLMQEIGGLVLDEACRQLRRWLDEGIDVGNVAVNLSPTQLSGRPLVETVVNSLGRYDLDAKRLVLEITEGCVMGPRGVEAAAILGELKAVGVVLALDDFGTGYASLSHLKALPVSQLKIDRGFVQELLAGKDDAAIVQAMISLAHDLGLEVVAEGVELPEQIAMLRQFGCNIGQGYAFARPMPADSFATFMHTRMPLILSATTNRRSANSGRQVRGLTLVQN